MNMGLRRLAPQFAAPSVELNPAARLRKSTHERLASRLRAARFETDRLFALLRGDALLERPVADKRPLIYYLGHLEAFDWNLLGKQGLGLKSFESTFDELFLAPVDSGHAAILMPNRATGWPSVPSIRSYNRRIRAALDQALESSSFATRLAHPGPGDMGAVELAIEHRLLHAEMLAALIHQLPTVLKKSGPLPAPSGEAPPSRMVSVAAGRAHLGLEKSASRFAWDHEYGPLSIDVPGFTMASRKVTNGDYLRFVDAGGYTEKKFWSAGSWTWLKTSGVTHPQFWVKSDDAWKIRAMFGEVPFAPSWPVYVSQAEAEAYARWSGARLPTEAEFHRAAFSSDEDEERAFPWGDTEPWPSYGVFGFERWDPAPVATHPAGDTPSGISELVGNGWEWTSTPFEPFPGFERSATCHGASENFLDGQHFVLKGASPRTATALLRRSFRYGLRSHDRFAYSAFRLVK